MTPSAPSPEPLVEEDLDHDPRAAGRARRTTREWLARWQVAQRVDDVTLVVSELVGNALRHGKPPVHLLLRNLRRRLEVEVHDTDPTAPALTTGGRVGPEAEGGRGLAIAAALADDLEVELLPDDGKIVRATFST